MNGQYAIDFLNILTYVHVVQRLSECLDIGVRNNSNQAAIDRALISKDQAGRTYWHEKWKGRAGVGVMKTCPLFRDSHLSDRSRMSMHARVRIV